MAELYKQSNQFGADFKFNERVENLELLEPGHLRLTTTEGTYWSKTAIIAAGIGAFLPGFPAPKVVNVSQIAKMEDNAIVVDISIDEGGSISSFQSDLTENIREEIESLGKNIVYVNDTNMPRKHPHLASEAHGKAVLPYLATIYI